MEATDTPPGPRVPRWTHIALPSADLDASIAWYETFTPLVLLDRREDADGQSAWLCHEGQAENPFILVLVMFYRDRGNRQPHLAPFAHIGIEVPGRQDVIDIAERARAADCLVWEPQQMPDPIGFICALTDPDGNVIEISHGQGVYAKVQEVWGVLGRVRPAEVVRAYVDTLNRHDLDAVVGLVTEDFHNEHTSVLGSSLRGRAAYRERLPAFLDSFDELRYELEDVIAEGDRVAAPYTLTARCTGPDGVARPVRIRGMFWFRVAGDLIAHRVDYWDSAEFTRQVTGA